MRRPTARARSWLALIALMLGLSALFSLVGLPSPVLFGALAAGLIYALWAVQALAVPTFAFTTGQAIIGASIGALFAPDTLASLREDWAPVIGVCVGPLVTHLMEALTRGKSTHPLGRFPA